MPLTPTKCEKEEFFDELFRIHELLSSSPSSEEEENELRLELPPNPVISVSSSPSSDSSTSRDAAAISPNEDGETGTGSARPRSKPSLSQKFKPKESGKDAPKHTSLGKLKVTGDVKTPPPRPRPRRRPLVPSAAENIQVRVENASIDETLETGLRSSGDMATKGKSIGAHSSLVSSQSHSKVRASAKEKKEQKKRKSEILDGLVFFFVPNNRLHPKRKLKMDTYERNGARCVGEWAPEEITHLIIDKLYRYEDVLKYLKLELLPDNIKVVKEDYPSDCLHHRRLLDSDQWIYTVTRKTPLPSTAPEPRVPQPPTVENTVQASLQIRPWKKHLNDTPSKESQDVPPDELVGHFLDGASHSAPVSPSNPSLPSLLSIPTSIDVAQNAPFAQSFDFGDDLDGVIQSAKQMQLLDVDNGGDSPSEASDSDSKLPCKRQKTIPLKKGSAATFQCLAPDYRESLEDNPNKRTIEVLEEMQQYYERTKDQWRALSYRKAINALKRHDKKICFASDAKLIPGIGSRIAEKIEEIVQTDHLRRLSFATLEPQDVKLKLFLGIYGVGIVQANKWIASGYRTLEDLKQKAQLTENQKIGIEHYDDFAQRIPRGEVDKHGEIVTRAAKEIDENVEIMVMGSYRRGAETCGDIDIMITKPGGGTTELCALLDALTDKLLKSGFLKCGLAVPRAHDDGSKWHGASALDNSSPWRRIDFLAVPWNERGAALIYFTGNDIFNRSLRLFASKKGYRLNQRGLYKNVIRGPKRARMTDGTLVEGADERKIFEILGVPYRSPEKRNC